MPLGKNHPTIDVAVCYALPNQIWQRNVRLPRGSSIRHALEASGFAADFPAVDPYTSGVGVYGKLRDPQFQLHEGDRVEIYRPLVFDPMESRRRRAQHRAAQAKGPVRTRRPRRV